MATLGGEKYPEISADTAIEIADVLVNEFGGSASSEEAFAQSVGHSTANSGSYISKIADVRRYGLLENRGLEATDLAYTVANPENPEEEKDARFEMYLNVGLLSDLYDHLNGKEPPEELWRVLVEITDTNPKDAKDASDEIRRLYKDMLQSEIEQRDKDSRKSPDYGTDTEKRGSGSTTVSSGIYVKVGEDEMRLQEVTNNNIKLAQLFLDSKVREDLSDSAPINEEQETEVITSIEEYADHS